MLYIGKYPTVFQYTYNTKIKFQLNYKYSIHFFKLNNTTIIIIIIIKGLLKQRNARSR